MPTSPSVRGAFSANQPASTGCGDPFSLCRMSISFLLSHPDTQATALDSADERCIARAEGRIAAGETRYGVAGDEGDQGDVFVVYKSNAEDFVLPKSGVASYAAGPGDQREPAAQERKSRNE